MIKYTFFILSLLAYSESALAESVVYQPLSEDKLRACLFIEDDQLRLRCFDGATGRSDVVKEDAKAPAAVEDVGGGLVLYKDVDKLTTSWLDRRWELAPGSKRGTFQLSPYKPVYLLPVFRSMSPNNMPTSPNPANRVASAEKVDQAETKFQLSLKTKVLENIAGDNGDVWFAYTQSSRWQIYSKSGSRPFRETDYEPEAILTWRSQWSKFTELTGWKPRLLGVSLNHQSNGRGLPLSRSWNRVIGMVGLERENTMIQIRPWIRISEPFDKDDNPDITDYMGHGDLLIVHKINGHELSLLARHNFKTGPESKGAAQLDWAFPVGNSLRGHVQYFTGYGESLIDYNHKSDYLGVGLSLVGWY